MSFDCKQKKVLLVEDEPLARWVARKCLEQASCFVSEAESCAQAQDMLMANAFDLLVMDHRLPDGLGIDVIRWFRKQGRTQPVLFLTAEAEVIDPAICRTLGLKVLLSKPVSTEALQEAVFRLIKEGASDEKALQQEGQGDRREGRYIVLEGGPESVATALVKARDLLAVGEWLAIDLDGWDTCLDETSMSALCQLAEQCNMATNRLCLISACRKVHEHLHETGLDRAFDLVREVRALGALGRRLSSVCERMALMDSIVDRQAQP